MKCENLLLITWGTDDMAEYKGHTIKIVSVRNWFYACKLPYILNIPVVTSQKATDTPHPDRWLFIPFMKCFTGLVGAFTPEEVIFMLYMADRTRLREKGYDTLRSKRYYMENMEMGSRIFDKCVEKTTRMGLLERVPVSGMYDYLWHMDSYNRLVGILAELGNPFSTRAFCHRMFDVEKRTVASVSDEEVSQWKERHRKV